MLARLKDAQDEARIIQIVAHIFQGNLESKLRAIRDIGTAIAKVQAYSGTAGDVTMAQLAPCAAGLLSQWTHATGAGVNACGTGVVRAVKRSAGDCVRVQVASCWIMGSWEQ